MQIIIQREICNYTSCIHLNIFETNIFGKINTQIMQICQKKNLNHANILKINLKYTGQNRAIPGPEAITSLMRCRLIDASTKRRHLFEKTVASLAAAQVLALILMGLGLDFKVLDQGFSNSGPRVLSKGVSSFLAFKICVCLIIGLLLRASNRGCLQFAP